MRLERSGLAIVRRGFDAAPAGQEVSFWDGDRKIEPLRKAGGVYLFLEASSQPLEVRCLGYQPVRLIPRREQLSYVWLYPDSQFSCPVGWTLLHWQGPPGQVLFCPDERYTLRLLEADLLSCWVRLWTRPGFVNGCLLFSDGQDAWLSRVLEKRPPDRFYLDRLDRLPDGGRVALGYAARADHTGHAVFVLPEGVAPGEGAILSDSSW